MDIKDDSIKLTRENSVGWMFKKIAAEFDRNMLIKLKPYNLNLGEFAILMTLFEKDNITQASIGLKVSMPGYATTRNIDTLEEKKLLKRNKNKNSRRSFLIKLNTKALELKPKLKAVVNEVNKTALEPLEDSQTTQLKFLLKQMMAG